MMRIPRRAYLPLGVLGVLCLAALLAPLLAPYDPTLPLDLTALKSAAPSFAHPFGTDPYSRDLLSRVMYGARVSLGVAGVATVLTVVFGIAYGALAGYVGGVLDSILMRLADALMAIPRILLLILIVALWQSLPLITLIIVIAATGWLNVSRIVRGQVLAIRAAPYVLAAQARGLPPLRIVWHHILPNALPAIFAVAALEFAHIIVLEAGLSYLGLGVQPPGASWGNLIRDGADQLTVAWWISVFPGLLIAMTSVAASALGDTFRAQLDPRTVVP